MNRTLVLGTAIFFAVVGIALLGGEKTAEAGRRGCGGCACDGAPDCGGAPACCGCRGHRERCHGARRCRGCNGFEGAADCGGCRGRRHHRRCCGNPCCGTPAPACNGSAPAEAAPAAPATPPAPPAPSPDKPA